MRLITKVRQLLCRHETETCVERLPGPYCNIQGKTIYHVCRKCGKVVSSEFLTWEDQLARFGKYL